MVELAVVAEWSKAACNLSTDCRDQMTQAQILVGTQILIAQSQKWLGTIQIVGCRVAAVPLRILNRAAL